jgi:hypothetical protein
VREEKRRERERVRVVGWDGERGKRHKKNKKGVGWREKERVEGTKETRTNETKCLK